MILAFEGNGQKGEYCYWNNQINATAYDTSPGDHFNDDSNILTMFKNYMAHFVNRTNTVNGQAYLTDPTIFSWELLSEGRYTTITDTNSGTTSSARLVAMTAWYSAASAYLKSIDSNHLVGTGSINQFYDYVNGDVLHNGTYYGLDYNIQHQLSTIDYFDSHWYLYDGSNNNQLFEFGQSLGFPNAISKAGALAQWNAMVALAKSAGKPCVIGEYGVIKSNTQNSYTASYPRAVNFNEWMGYFFADDGDGFVVWHYTNLFDDNNYNIKPDGPHSGGNANNNANDDDTQLRQVLRQKSAEILGQRATV